MPKSRVRDTRVRRLIDPAVDPVFYIDRTFDICEFTDVGRVVRARRFCTPIDLIDW